jgi:hypothetical protein
VRYIPGELARAMVAAGTAEIHNANGKAKSIRLVETAATHLVRIGEPSDGWLAPRFSVREKLDNGGVVWRHRLHSILPHVNGPRAQCGDPRNAIA